MTDRIGQQLGNYRVIRLLGHGGFAEVYLGEHLFLKTAAAIKVLHRQLTDRDAAQFVQEAQTLATLKHPYIVRVLDFAIQDEVPFLVMEYAPNGTLRQLHPAGTRLSLDIVVLYVQHIASALQYAHDRRLIHRDVKPENMLLDEHREVFLSDFGLALLLPLTASIDTRPIDQLMSGTVPYMAPEQLQGNPEPASDQYALGIVVYEWLCGSRPFNGSSVEIAMQHLALPPPSMREQVPELSPAIEVVVLRALAKEPRERFACVQDFARALEKASQQALEGSFVSVSFPPEEEPPLPQQGRQILDIGGSKTKPFWNMPATFTPLVGREQDVTVIATLLKRPEVRLLTLTGTGGVGKSRLSIQVALELRDDFLDGICFVPLASISDPALVIPCIAQALDFAEGGGRTGIDLLQATLKDKDLLLLLDNFEQVVTAAPQLLDVLAMCPHLKILVTSRAPLHLHGEQQFPVLPLELPDLKELPEVESLSEYAAVALFLQCAQAVKPAFQLTSANAKAIVEICTRLDGLPLAIELAASRIKLLPPHALLARLSQRLQLLTSRAQAIPARHQTLRNTIAWSYDLLEADERQLFQRISVFVGGYTLEAIEALYAALGNDSTAVSVLDGLSSLIDKSLLQPMGGGRRATL